MTDNSQLSACQHSRQSIVMLVVHSSVCHCSKRSTNSGTFSRA